MAGISARAPAALNVRRASLVALTVGLVVCSALALVAGAKAETAPGTLLSSPIVLGPINVANGTAVLTGTVGGDPTAAASLTINGKAVGVNPATGVFNAVVDLNGLTYLELALGDTVTKIPLVNLGANGIVPAGILNSLRSAGISLLIPPDGLKTFDGNPLRIEGEVFDRTALVSLRVNGQEVISLLKSNTATSNPNDATFSVPVSGNSREVAITATDKQGVAQTTSFSIKRATSVISTSAGKSVSALGARGLRFFKVQYFKKGVQTTHRVRMVVTLKDTRGFLVRGGIVRVRARDFMARAMVGGQQTKFTEKTGRASFILRLNPTLFSAKTRRLFTVAVAVTPSRSVKKNTSVSLPRLRSGI